MEFSHPPPAGRASPARPYDAPVRCALPILALALVACDTPGAPASIDAAIDASIDAAVDATIDAATDAPSVCDRETRADTYQPGMTRTGDHGFTAALLGSVPGPPPRGNSAWDLRLTDAAAIARDDLALRITPFMPDHGHGTAVVAHVTAAGADGRYHVAPVNLWMPGLWSIRVAVADAAAPTVELDAITFWFCVP